MTTNESAINTEGNSNLVQLSRYDRLRVPLPATSKDFDVSSGVILERYKKELSCKVCKKLLVDPVLSRTCMHRFCSKCVVNGPDIALQQCPECNVQFRETQAFLRDHTFCKIIKKIKPKECDTGRRNLYATLQATGVDVNGHISKARLDQHLSRNQWACNEAFSPGTSKVSSMDNNDGPPILDSSFSLSRDNNTPQPDDVIHLISQNGAIKIFYQHLVKLPFILESMLQLSESSRYSTSLQAYSLCGSLRPNFVAKLKEIRLTGATTTKESKQILLQMPAFILKLFPKDFITKYLRERDFIPDNPLLTQKQRLNRGLLIGVILFPDSSVLKMKDIPSVMRRPRYILSPPNATIGHLKEYLMIRSEVESRFHPRHKFFVEFAAILGERQEIILRLNTNPDESPVEGEPREFVLRVRCSPPTYADKRLSNFDNMIVLRYPFEPLPNNLSIKDLVHKSTSLNRPLKVVFRYISKS